MNSPTTKPRQAPLPEPSMGEVLQAVFQEFIMATPIFKAPRMVINAVPGWGKTSTVAFADGAAIVMAHGETGYETLLGAGLVPAIPTVRIASWGGFLKLLDNIRDAETPPCKLLAIDEISGIERLCHEYICFKHFNGNWDEKGFTSFQKGFDIAVPEWVAMLERLDAIHERGIPVVLLGHVQIRTFKNPVAEDYDRWVSNVHHKTWSVTHRWADVVLFGNFVSVVDKDNPKAKKGKGIGGTERVLYCEYRDAYDAKNRYGMSGEIAIPNDPSKTWATIWNAITKKGA